MRELRRLLLLLSACSVLGAAAWSQDSGSPAPGDDEATATAAQTGEDTAELAEEDEVAIDDESYIDIEEEDFRPSEEIDADQSIPFPTDI